MPRDEVKPRRGKGPRNRGSEGWLAKHPQGPLAQNLAGPPRGREGAEGMQPYLPGGREVPGGNTANFMNALPQLWGGPGMPGTTGAMQGFFGANPQLAEQAAQMFRESKGMPSTTRFTGATSVSNSILDAIPGAREAYLASLNPAAGSKADYMTQPPITEPWPQVPPQQGTKADYMTQPPINYRAPGLQNLSDGRMPGTGTPSVPLSNRVNNKGDKPRRYRGVQRGQRWQ